MLKKLFWILMLLSTTSSQLILNEWENCIELKTNISWLDSISHFFSYQLNPILTDYRKSIHQQYYQRCAVKVYDSDS
jgi:hypothetical protein